MTYYIHAKVRLRNWIVPGHLYHIVGEVETLDEALQVFEAQLGPGESIISYEEIKRLK
jgi:hypothetical protein